MELILNLAWLTLAFAAFARLAVWARGETDRRRVWIVALATVCVVVLLFPIVSITDDLQESVAAVEETFAVRRVVAAAALHLTPVIVAALALSAVITVLTILGFVTVEAFALPSAPALVACTLRGPPLPGC
jgi:hypothetical protein